MNSTKQDPMLKFAAIFLIALVVAIPFNVSSALAQGLPTPDEACLEKGKKNDAMAELLQNEVITNLEKTFTILHGINTIWQSQVVIIDVLILGSRFSIFEPMADFLHKWRNLVENPFGGLGAFADLANYVLTCTFPGGFPNFFNLYLPI